MEYDLSMDRVTNIVTVLGVLTSLLPLAIFVQLGALLKPIFLIASVSIMIVSLVMYLYVPKKVVIRWDGD